MSQSHLPKNQTFLQVISCHGLLLSVNGRLLRVPRKEPPVLTLPKPLFSSLLRESSPARSTPSQLADLMARLERKAARLDLRHAGVVRCAPARWFRPDIANIEVEQIVFAKPDDDVDYTHGVRMILKSGRVFHVAGNLMPDQAHELAVSLSHARETMRYEPSTTSPRARSREAVY